MSEPEHVTIDDVAPTSVPIPTAPAPTVTSETPPAEQVASSASTSANAVDDAGTPFDGTRHLPKKHPRTGRWLPRGGRKPRAATTTPSTDASTSQPPPPSFIPPQPPPPPESAAQPPPKSEASSAQAVDHSEDAGEVLCSAVEVAAGVIFDAPEDCTPPVAEHKNMVRAVAAYVRSRGWHIAAGLGVGLMFAAYLLRVVRKPKPGAKLRSWLQFDRAEKARDVTPENVRPSNAPSPKKSDVIDLPPNIPPLAPQ